MITRPIPRASNTGRRSLRVRAWPAQKYTFPEPSNAAADGAAVCSATVMPLLVRRIRTRPRVQAPAQAWNYTMLPSGSVQVHPPGVASPPETHDISTTTPQDLGTIAGMLSQSIGSQYNYGSPTPPVYSYAPPGQQAPLATPGEYTPIQSVPTVGAANPTALLPNQINAENYRNMYDYQKQLGWAGFEDAGWDKGLAQDAFKKSLPTYVNPTQGKIAAF
jgi:hypothetical protein